MSICSGSLMSPGFYNAPLSKFTLTSVAACSVAASVFHLRHWFPLHLSLVVAGAQVQRLVVSHCAFTSSSELLFGGVLLYYLRGIERLYGTRKFAVFVTVTSTLATLLNVSILVLLRGFVNWTAPGPYAWIFASLFIYHERVPETDKFEILGIRFSQKSFVYLLAVQLLAADWSHSWLPALSGLVAGAVWATDLFGMQSWRFPRAIEKFATRFLAPLLQSPPPERSTNPEVPRPPARTTAANNAATTMAPNVPAMPEQPVHQDSIELLVAMGFDRERATTVLRRVGGDMERAVQALL
ncbi:hypothetical protein GGF31_003744 [Allomyces arbusculus]|nr:hypothetical protein GGF31_003744 [Allomyces arbusculus]